MSSSPIIAWNEMVVSLVQGIANSDSEPELDLFWRSSGPAARLYALLNVVMHDALAGVTTGSGDRGSPPLKRRWIKEDSVPPPRSLLCRRRFVSSRPSKRAFSCSITSSRNKNAKMS
jgi:hypothetical protein